MQCVNNPATCTVTYALPAAGFIEPAPEFLCPQCHVPRVKIIFRGQRPDLYCINPECPENHKAFRIGVCPSCGSALQIRYSFLGKRFVGCSGYPTCRVTYPLPQRGKLEKDQPPCPVCRAPVVTAIEAGRPPWTLCINPACPTRGEPKKAGEKAAPAGAQEGGRHGDPPPATAKAKTHVEAPAIPTAAAPPAKVPRRRKPAAPKETPASGGPAGLRGSGVSRAGRIQRDRPGEYELRAPRGVFRHLPPRVKYAPPLGTPCLPFSPDCWT